ENSLLAFRRTANGTWVSRVLVPGVQASTARFTATIMNETLATAPPVNGLFKDYLIREAYDEMFDRDLRPRGHYGVLHQRLLGLNADEFRRRKTMTDL